jgi:photosystem II stability/assembly factor-like uncharacterized protein
MAIILFFFLSWNGISAQNIERDIIQGMKYRHIGPFRGGRSLACTGIKGDRNTYYFGATGGGVWKTEDAGESWLPISDTTFMASSIGSIAVAPSDPSIIYVGTGECDIRGNISFGEGMYRSLDAGKKWKRISPTAFGSIAKIAIHPNNPDEVLIAAMGRIFGANPERGIYKTTNGGANWTLVLKRNGKLGDSTGAIDIQRDPHNPRNLYAALWQASRNAYSMSSGGAGSGIFRSTDGGDTWDDISTNPGLPKGILGKIRIAISPAKRDRIWAMIEHEHGGLFRSEDAGATWSKVSEDRNIRQRPWYFSHITADPKNPDIIYALNVGIFRSTDGGRTFSGLRTMHGDHHDMWIDPDDSERFILADDGGAFITNTGGKTYSDIDIPTAQFYHVTTDNQVPYRVYGCQQDNSSIGIASRSFGWSIDKSDWFIAAGGESGYIAVDPKDHNIIYGGNYGGFLSKLNRKNMQDQDVSVYPENVVGSAAANHHYRFQWTYPIVFSKHDEQVLYTCGNHVFKSSNEGHSWERISDDLTTKDSNKMQASGGMITKDNTGVETYCTIFAFSESPLNKNVLWAGTDDGLIHITRDGGKTWKNVTPKILPNNGKPALISIIDAGHFNEGTAYIAATRYKSADDQKPYLLKTTNYGASWEMITTGIPENAYARVIREDPKQKGLLFAGTEIGIFVSINDGASWTSMQNNLPRSPIHDLVIQEREGDVVIAMHGRSFWILDDITPLRTIASVQKQQNITLFKPRLSWRMEGGSWYSPTMQTGENLPNGVLVYYHWNGLGNAPITLEFRDQKDSLLRTFSSDKDIKGEKAITESIYHTEPGKEVKNAAVSLQKGLNRFFWDMHTAPATESPVVMWGASTRGPKVIPGIYSVTLKHGDSIIAKQQFDIASAIGAKTEDLKLQFDLHVSVNAKVSETHKTVNRIRDMKTAIAQAMAKMKKEVKDTNISSSIMRLGTSITDSLNAIEYRLVQNKAKAGQDLLNHPMKLNNKLAALTSTIASSDTKPTEQTYEAVKKITALIQKELDAVKELELIEVKRFNEQYVNLKLPVIGGE